MKTHYILFEFAKRIKKLANKFALLLLVTVAMSGMMQAQFSYTFTAAGLTGPIGPTQSQINTAYASTNLNGSVTVLTATPGVQTFTIPLTGPYRITAVGAQGGYNGGAGTSMAGDFTLSAGTVLKILVGQQGTQGTNNAPNSAGGGGGGSFVTSLTNIPYVVAGGGGGNGDGYGLGPVGCCLNGMEASTLTAANPYPGGSNGGTAGNGGTCGSYCAGSGAGFFGNGSLCNAGTTAMSFTNGGVGGNGYAFSGTLGNGGFGGGGGHADSGTGMRGGGGGGYSGGGGGVANSGTDRAGGGGGSINSGANQVNAVSTTTGNGKVIIDLLCNIKITSSGSNSLAPSICSGQSLTLTTNAVSNYTWSTGNTTTTSIVVSPTSSQSYSIIGTSSLACQAVANISVIVSSALPALTITNTPNSICLGKTATLTAGGAVTYTWSGGSVPVVNGQSFLPTVTAIYTVAGQNGCGISTSTTAITIAPLVVTASANPTLVCSGGTSTLTAVSSVNGYTWMPLSYAANPAVYGPTVNTIYTVSASDGTCFGTATVAVNTKPTPTISIIASNSIVCEGALLTMTASGAQTYTWSPGNTTNAILTDYPVNPTAYQVVGTSSNGCTSQASNIVITQPSPTLAIAADKTIVCSGDPVILTASGANSYNWTNGPATAINQVNPTGTTIYTVTGTASNSCTSVKTVSVNVLTASVAVSAATTSICKGGTTTLTASGANSYVWTGISSINGVAVVSPTSTTIYSVTANTTITGLSCPSSTNISVTVFNNPTVSIVATKSVMCKSDPAITLTGTGAVTYAWSTGTTSPGISVKPSTTTTYSVLGTDANGCQSSGTKLITVNVCNSIGELSGIEKGLFVYPNPSSGNFQIQSEMDLDLKLVNELGQEIRTIKLSAQNNHIILVEDLANGVYFIIGQNDTVKINQKVIIVK